MAVRPSLCWNAYPALSIGAGATSPNPGRPGVYAWSIPEDCLLAWNGDVWSRVITLHDLNALIADGAFRPGRFETLIGNALATSFTVTHNLGTRSVSISVFDESTGTETALATKRRASADTVVISFTLPPALNQYRVLIQA